MADERIIRRFSAATGASFGHAEADAIGRYLETIVGLGGRPVSAEEVVVAARPKASPLHKHVFDKNQRAAAHEYYLSRARHIIRHIVVEEAKPDGETVATRAFHHVTDSGDDGSGSGYVSQHVVWRTPDFTEQVVARAMQELRIWRDRYRQYQELAEATHGVEAILEAA